MMKKLNVEKQSTLKGIVIGFVVCCCLFGVVAFADLSSISFEEFTSDKHDKKLTDSMWDGVLGQLDAMKKSILEEVKIYLVPSGTVIIYDGEGNCPEGWDRWYGDGERFIVPLPSGEIGTKRGGSGEIQIGIENLPKHSHLVVGGQDSATLSSDNALSSKNFVGNTNKGDADYHLAGVAGSATMGKSSEVGSGKAIKYIPAYTMYRFCRKN